MSAFWVLSDKERDLNLALAWRDRGGKPQARGGPAPPRRRVDRCRRIASGIFALTSSTAPGRVAGRRAGESFAPDRCSWSGSVTKARCRCRAGDSSSRATRSRSPRDAESSPADVGRPRDRGSRAARLSGRRGGRGDHEQGDGESHDRRALAGAWPRRRAARPRARRRGDPVRRHHAGEPRRSAAIAGPVEDVERASKALGHVQSGHDARPTSCSSGLGITIGGLVGLLSVTVGGVPIALTASGGALIMGLVFGWLRSGIPPSAGSPSRRSGCSTPSASPSSSPSSASRPARASSTDCDARG